MNYVLYLTDKCNMACKYCYERKMENDISFENIKKLIDYIIRTNENGTVNLAFYGGEPLLKFDLIKETINYINSKKSTTNFFYSITTNGTLITKEILDYFNDNNFLFIQYSIDGTEESHDLNRKFRNGEDTYSVVCENAKMVLQNFKKVVANKVITKNNVKFLSNDIKVLVNMGFKEFYLLIAYEQDWNDEDLITMKNELYKVAEIYENEIINENDIDILLIDEKINSHINSSHDCNSECKMGMKSIKVGADGNFYPCMQFVGDNKYIIGNCENGIDIEARKKLIDSSKKELETCKECSLRRRCNHTCSCKNYSITNDINELSPIVCEIERIIIEVSDKMAERLYKNGSKLFIQKYYNKNYSLIKSLENNIKNQ